jgi:hypothetical protein
MFRFNRTSLYTLVMIGLVYGAGLWSLLFITRSDVIGYLALEDGIFESFGASFFFLAALVFAIAFILSRSGNTFLHWHTRRNYFFLLLSAVMVFGGGEEISWGQRVFHFKTSAELAKINVQHEFNVHNLSGSHLMQIFTLGWLAFVVGVPLVNRLNTPLRDWFKTLGLPIVPVELGFLVLANYFILKLCLISGLKDDEIYGGGITEIYENIAELHFLLVSIACYIRYVHIPRKQGRE